MVNPQNGYYVASKKEEKHVYLGYGVISSQCHELNTVRRRKNVYGMLLFIFKKGKKNTNTNVHTNVPMLKTNFKNRLPTKGRGDQVRETGSEVRLL